jgi:hypothetical protein
LSSTKSEREIIMNPIRHAAAILVVLGAAVLALTASAAR